MERWPETIFNGQLEMNAVGYALVKAPTTQTSVAGVFAAGDVRTRATGRR